MLTLIQTIYWLLLTALFLTAITLGMPMLVKPEAITSPEASKASLVAHIEQTPLGLPDVPLPDDAPITEEKAELGRKLFFDKRLSFNNTISCASCHIPEQGFTNNQLAVPVGFQGRSGRRNAMTLYNVAYMERLFHDGREYSLKTLIFGPLLDEAEMGNPSVGHVLNKIESLPDYEDMIQLAFGGNELSMDRLGTALATYMRLILSGNSRFDRWYFGQENQELTKEEQLGFRLFKGKANCISCHTIGADYALFADNKFHNTGLGWSNTFRREYTKKDVEVAPGVILSVDKRHIDAVRQRQRPNDIGLYEVTQNPDDRWKYRTPSLRNITLTSPYMHDGSLKTLEEVIDFYDQGGHEHDLISPLIQPLNLTDAEKDALISFLHTLKGDNIHELSGTRYRFIQ